jgi:Domain of unknown function (DUF4395)
MGLAAWMDSNLAIQGYRLSPEETHRLRLGLRFPTALCLVLVATGLALESAPILFALAGIGLIAGFTPRHPFDLIWNRALRHAFDAPEVPPNPPRRRHAFKLATAWLLATAVLFATGAGTAALALGIALLAACSVVTIANFCIPSELMALWARLTTKRLEATP